MRTPVSLIIYITLVGCASSPAPQGGSPAPRPEPTATPGDAPIVEDLAEPNRPLTPGELALLRPIFRDGIDYARVRVINNRFPLQPENVYMTPRGHVYAPGVLWQADFSTARSSLRAVFVHEMAHVWQHANGMDLVSEGFIELTRHRGDYEKAYPYELARGRDLVDYGMEQQASIIEDHFVITVDQRHPHMITNRGITDTERNELYAAVMKNFHGDARYA
nr:hypothetical protein [Deltaproteobacteria bacterium]